MDTATEQMKETTFANATALAQRILKGETNIKESLGITDQQMEAIYLVAFNSYQSGKYNDALKIFSILSAMHPLESKYWFGMGACCQQLESLTQAGFFYYVCTVMSKGEQPEAFLHLAECLIMLDDPTAARFNLNQLIEKHGSNPQASHLIDRARLMLKRL